MATTALFAKIVTNDAIVNSGSLSEYKENSPGITGNFAIFHSTIMNKTQDTEPIASMDITIEESQSK